MVTDDSTIDQPVLLHNALVHTMDEANPVADTVVIEKGRIGKVGKWSELSRIEAGQTVDLRGLTVIPGLVDSHAHLLSYGLSLGEVDLTDARSIDEVLSLLSSAGVEGEVLRSSQLDPDSLAEGRYPTMSELDSVSSDRPVFVKRRDEHSSALNQAAFRLLALPPDTEGIEVDPRTNRPSGILKKKANQMALEFFHGMIDDAEMREAYLKASWSAAGKGATTVHSLVGADEDPKRSDCETLMAMSEELLIRTIPYYQTRDVEKVARLGLDRIGGCILLDGSIGSRTAAFSADYLDDPGNNGSLYLTDEELLSFFESAEERGLQIAVHAIGDRAVEQALRSFERLVEKYGREDRRHRIEHAEYVLDGQFDRIAEAGISLGMQPAFEGFWGETGGMYERRLGVHRAGELNALASAVSRGICVAGGSDAPITPIDPIYGIHCAVNHPSAGSRLSVRQALEAFTSAGARIAHKEGELGAIKSGFHADLVGLSADPFSIEPDKIREIEMVFVICRGRLVVDRIGGDGQGARDA
jgi:predicted amidohydrolase YtcJ